MILTGETEVLGEKPVAVSVCPSQILNGLAHLRTQASDIRCR